MKSKLDLLKKVITTYQHKYVKCRDKKILIDTLTAQGILLIYDKLNEVNKEKYLNMDWDKMASIAWKHCTLGVA